MVSQKSPRQDMIHESVRKFKAWEPVVRRLGGAVHHLPADFRRDLEQEGAKSAGCFPVGPSNTSIWVAPSLAIEPGVYVN
jgi:hypothetical protein